MRNVNQEQMKTLLTMSVCVLMALNVILTQDTVSQPQSLVSVCLSLVMGSYTKHANSNWYRTGLLNLFDSVRFIINIYFITLTR